MSKLQLLTLFVVVLPVALLTSYSSAPRRTDAVLLSASVSQGENVGAVAARARAEGFDVTATYNDIHAFEVTASAGDASAIVRLQRVQGVRFAEQVRTVVSADFPSDTLYGQESQYLQEIGAPAAWNITQGQPNIVVAVIDTGVDVQHSDLQANMWVNAREVPNNGVDDDGNGCTDDVNGCSFVSDSSPGCQNVSNGYVNDDIGHGTFVSSVLAGAANGTGVVGVARNVRIMAVKVLDCHGAGDTVATARGVTYAVQNGARIINMSLGGLDQSQILEDAINDAVARGVVVVAAAGNDGTSQIAFPARLPNVISVGATRVDGLTRAVFSDWGPQVDVVAAGENIVGAVPQSRCDYLFNCLPQGPWAVSSGTSFSTPQVAGLAALMLSLNPGLTPSQVRSIIENSATALPAAGQPEWAGNGRANMLAALQSVQGNRPPGDPCTVASVVDGDTFTCSSGLTVRMLGITAPAVGQCGGEWAKAALANIFLTPGRTVYLRYDVGRTSAGATLAAPLWRGADGNDYNLSIVMAFVGLARATPVGTGNFLYQQWASDSEHWAQTAQWNMWAPGKPFRGGC